jgi:photosystem II stability/assembly factor-like uncharacterized protein
VLFPQADERRWPEHTEICGASRCRDPGSTLEAMRWALALLLAALCAATGARAEETTQPMSISFWDERTGMLVSSTWGPADIGRSTVQITRDGGRSWTVMRTFSSKVEVSAVRGTRIAFAATPSGLFRTRDKGASWVRVSPRAVEKPSFATPLAGWAIEEPRIVSTRNGGRNWRTLRGPCETYDTVQAALASSTRGWVVCSSQPGAGQQPKDVWSTRDAGASWQLVTRASPFGKKVGRGLEVSGYPRGVAMTVTGRGWLWMARGSFFATGDGGHSWSWLPISVPEIVEGRSASLLTGKVGYALFGHRPALRFTRDGGRTWTVVRRWSP